MAGGIKGITVEIGGNTAPLEKALQGVNKTSRDLQNELKQVEKLLKLDPTNTELITQKQKLLAESITTTKTKLDTLKEAERQVQQQVKEGKVSEEQYRAFQREIAKTEQSLKSLGKEAKETGNSIKNFSDSMGKFGANATAAGQKMLPATAAIVTLGVAAVNSASDLNESMNKVQVAFKTSAGAVVEWSETTLDKFGMAQGSALDMAALFGDMGTAMGQTPAQAQKMSTSLVGLAGDLASFKNIGIQQAQDALKGIFTGEGESLKSLGVIMQDSTLKEYALAQGIKKKYDEMTQSEKVQLRYNYVMEMTKNAQGDFARTSDGTANSTRVLGESMKELSAAFGEMLLPIITPIIQKITEMVKWIGSLDSGTKTIILVVLGIIAIAGPLLMLIGSIATGISALTALFAPLTVATGAATVAQTGLNVAMAANPIGLIIISIVALIALIVILVQNWDQISSDLSIVWKNITTTVSQGVEAVKGFLAGIIEFVKTNWQAILLFIVNPFAGAFKFLYDNCEAFRNFINDFVNNIVSFFTDTIPGLVNSIIEWFQRLPEAMLDIGRNIVNGIWEGIQNAVKWLFDRIADFGKGIVDAIKRVLGIHSPSRVLADEVGKYMAQGIGVGFENEMGKVTAGMTLTMPTSRQDFGLQRPESAGQGSAAGSNVHIFQPGSVVIDAKNVRDFNTVVEMVSGLTQASRARG